uniref:Xrn1 N-terminal domain-containing protein n=1 Tax=Parascaris equorum TaxID=6256 RepID=A0A914R1E5_PAREQ
MGVPKFYRWISERYPCLSEVVTHKQCSTACIELFGDKWLYPEPTVTGRVSDQYNPEFFFQIPEFDNLYLDMNGIIHGCTHPNDEDISFRISEEQIFRDIFNYID